MHLFRLFLMLVHLLPLMAEGESSESSEDTSEDVKPKPPTFTDEQQRFMNDRLAAERKEAERKTADRIKTESTKQAENDKAERDRKQSEDAGKYEEAKTALTNERDTAVSERDTLKTEVETLRIYVTGDIDAALKDDTYKPFKRFDPGADAPIADRLKWLADAKAAIAETPRKMTSGNGPNPPITSTTVDEDAARAQARRTVRI